MIQSSRAYRFLVSVTVVMLVASGCSEEPEQAKPNPPTPSPDASSGDVGVLADAATLDVPEPPKPCTEGDNCNDGDPCTSSDICIEGECVGAPYECDDALPCTLNKCDGKGGCDYPLQAGLWCLIAGTCVADGEQRPDDPCYACVAPISPIAWSANDGAACDDGLQCTGGDTCADGGCHGTKDPCDDQNPCTTNGCKEGEGCIHAALQGPCEDGDFCTVGDTCTNQVCVPGPKTLDCNDGDPCTEDACSVDGGCTHAPHSGACEDGDPCTKGDKCIEGECIPGSDAPACSDGNPCTNDVCIDGYGCAHVPNLLPCEDGDVCTVGDICTGGKCSPGLLPKDCADNEPCTQDICEPFKGCNHIPTPGTCDDSNPCTSDDHCQGGYCKGVPGVDCDDGNPCTDDICDAKVAGGCVNKHNTAPCDDGDPCTVGDVCKKGDCKAAAANCDDGNPCTVDTCQGAEGCVYEVANAPGCLVQVQLTQPKRALTLTGQKTITVKGTVQSPIAPLAFVTLNDKEVTVGAGGTFTTQITALHGINILEAVAEDVLGNNDKSVRAFYFSTKYLPMSSQNPKASKMSKGIYIGLGPEAIDDGNHAPDDADDLATILEIIIQAFDIGALLPNPLMNTDQYKVTVSNVQFQPAKVKLTPVPVGLNLWASIKKFSANVKAEGKCWYCPSASGKITIAEILIITDLSIKTKNDAADVALKNTDVMLINPDVDVSGIAGWLFDWLIDLIVNGFVDDIQNAFKSELGKVIPDTMEDALNSLAFDTSFEVPAFFPGGKAVTVKLVTGLEHTFFDDDGGSLRLWAAATAPKKTTHEGLGTLRRDACLTGKTESLGLTLEHPLQFGIMDDVLNQILYSVWWAGALEFPVPPSLLGDVDLGAYGIEDLELTVDFLLPPIVTSCNKYADLLLQFGDARVHVTGNLFGQVLELDLYASAEAWVDLNATSDGIGLAINDFKRIATDVVVLTPGLQSAEKLIDELVADELVPQLFSVLGGDALAGFPLPTIDLGGLAEGVPAGTEIAIDPQKIFRDLGWTVVSGKIK